MEFGRYQYSCPCFLPHMIAHHVPLWDQLANFSIPPRVVFFDILARLHPRPNSPREAMIVGHLFAPKPAPSLKVHHTSSAAAVIQLAP